MGSAKFIGHLRRSCPPPIYMSVWPTNSLTLEKSGERVVAASHFSLHVKEENLLPSLKASFLDLIQQGRSISFLIHFKITSSSSLTGMGIDLLYFICHELRQVI
jgi:hypothetical protein